MPNPQLLPPNKQSVINKQQYIDYLNKFISIIDTNKEALITLRKSTDLMNHGKERDSVLFFLNCIEDGSNSLGCSLEKYDKCDIVKGISYIVFMIFFHSINVFNHAHTGTRVG